MSLRIVLVDSGVRADHPHVREFVSTVESLRVRGPASDGHCALEPESATDTLGHGTAAVAALLDIAARGADARGIELVSLRVFDDGPEAPFERVLAALEHTLRIEARIVNLSLGTSDDRWREALDELGRAFAKRGVAVVSPAAERGLPMLPGSLPNYEGVLVDARLPREAPERRASGERTYWYASPYPRELPGLARARNLAGVSMAAANVSGFLAQRALTTRA